MDLSPAFWGEQGRVGLIRSGPWAGSHVFAVPDPLPEFWFLDVVPSPRGVSAEYEGSDLVSSMIDEWDVDWLPPGPAEAAIEARVFGRRPLGVKRRNKRMFLLSVLSLMAAPLAAVVLVAWIVEPAARGASGDIGPRFIGVVWWLAQIVGGLAILFALAIFVVRVSATVRAVVLRARLRQMAPAAAVTLVTRFVAHNVTGDLANAGYLSRRSPVFLGLSVTTTGWTFWGGSGSPTVLLSIDWSRIKHTQSVEDVGGGSRIEIWPREPHQVFRFVPVSGVLFLHRTSAARVTDLLERAQAIRKNEARP